MITIKRFLPNKQFISGLIIGALILVSVNSIADSVVVQNLIGKTIQGQFDVSVDGKGFSTPAIVVDGTSFLPVREFGESVGYTVLFDTEGGIKLEQKIDVSSILSAQDLSEQALLEQEQMNAADDPLIESKLSQLRELLKYAEAKVISDTEIMESSKANFEVNNPGRIYESEDPKSLYQRYTALINEDKAEVERIKAEIAALETQTISQ